MRMVSAFFDGVAIHAQIASSILLVGGNSRRSGICACLLRRNAESSGWLVTLCSEGSAQTVGQGLEDQGFAVRRAQAHVIGFLAGALHHHQHFIPSLG